MIRVGQETIQFRHDHIDIQAIGSRPSSKGFILTGGTAAAPTQMNTRQNLLHAGMDRENLCYLHLRGDSDFTTTPFDLKIQAADLLAQLLYQGSGLTPPTIEPVIHLIGFSECRLGFPGYHKRMKTHSKQQNP